jgi:putative Mn2+ efflux pump MntP
MTGVFSLINMVLGPTIACLAARFPRRQKVLETLGGVLLIFGLALLGYSLDLMFGRP